MTDQMTEVTDQVTEVHLLTYEEIRDFETRVQSELPDVMIFRDICQSEYDEQICYRIEFHAEYFRSTDFIQLNKSVKATILSTLCNQEFYRITFKPEVEASLKTLSDISDDDLLVFKYRFFLAMCDPGLESSLIENVEGIDPNSITESESATLIIARWREKSYWPWSLVKNFKCHVWIDTLDFARQTQEFKKFLHVCNGDEV